MTTSSSAYRGWEKISRMPDSTTPPRQRDLTGGLAHLSHSQGVGDRNLLLGNGMTQIAAGRTPTPTAAPVPSVDRTELEQTDNAATTRCSGHGNGYPAPGGLWAGVDQSPRWVRSFSITSGCSMNIVDAKHKRIPHMRCRA